MAKAKKAEVGISATPSLRKGQYKRIGRISDRNPERAERVANRMIERDTRLERGKAFVKGLTSKMQAGGVASKKVKAPMVDPDGAWTKVQERTLAQAKDGKWIQKAIKKPGALRSSLGVKKGEKIPAGKLAAAAKKPGKMGQRARLAQTLKKMKKK